MACDRDRCQEALFVRSALRRLSVIAQALWGEERPGVVEQCPSPYPAVFWSGCGVVLGTVFPVQNGQPFFGKSVGLKECLSC